MTPSDKKWRSAGSAHSDLVKLDRIPTWVETNRLPVRKHLGGRVHRLAEVRQSGNDNVEVVDAECKVLTE